MQTVQHLRSPIKVDCTLIVDVPSGSESVRTHELFDMMQEFRVRPSATVPQDNTVSVCCLGFETEQSSQEKLGGGGGCHKG